MKLHKNTFGPEFKSKMNDIFEAVTASINIYDLERLTVAKKLSQILGINNYKIKIKKYFENYIDKFVSFHIENHDCYNLSNIKPSVIEKICNELCDEVDEIHRSKLFDIIFKIYTDKVSSYIDILHSGSNLHKLYEILFDEDECLSMFSMINTIFILSNQTTDNANRLKIILVRIKIIEQILKENDLHPNHKQMVIYLMFMKNELSKFQNSKYSLIIDNMIKICSRLIEQVGSIEADFVIQNLMI